jgi:DNA end-binding protein Ku
MAPRPSWKGYLRLSLVSCPVVLYPATTTSERVSFRTLNRDTGNRVRRQYVDEATGETVEPDQQVKGYEIGKREYVLVEEDEIKAIQLESTHTLDIEQFVSRSEVDELYLDTPYYLAPDDRVGQEAFAVIRESMSDSGMVGIARVVLFRRERIVMLEPRDRGMVATTLRYANEVHAADAYFEEIPDQRVPGEMADLAKHIIGRMTGEFTPSRFEDRYEQALVDLIRAKQAGTTPAPQPIARPSNVVNLMDALRRSVAAETGKNEPAKENGRKAERAEVEEKAKPPRKAIAAERGAREPAKREPASPKKKSRPRKAG